MSWGRLQKRKSKVAQFMNKHYFHWNSLMDSQVESFNVKKKWIFLFAESRKPMCLCPFSIIVIIMTISNYLMRLGRMWRLLIEEDVIHRHDRGLGPRWIASSEICVILYIMRKRGSIIVLLFIQSYIFKFLTCLPPRRLSSKLWPISRNSFRI